MTHKLKVLLADDDEDDIAMFRDSIEQVGLPHEILCAKGQSEICAILERVPDIDLVFLDINLPGTGGKECLKWIKGEEKYKKLPVIIFTSSKSVDDINDLYEWGAHYYAIKPYSMTNYKETLRRIFDIDWRSQQPIPNKDQFLINLAFV